MKEIILSSGIGFGITFFTFMLHTYSRTKCFTTWVLSIVFMYIGYLVVKSIFLIGNMVNSRRYPLFPGVIVMERAHRIDSKLHVISVVAEELHFGRAAARQICHNLP